MKHQRNTTAEIGIQVGTPGKTTQEKQVSFACNEMDGAAGDLADDIHQLGSNIKHNEIESVANFERRNSLGDMALAPMPIIKKSSQVSPRSPKKVDARKATWKL
eukprot:GHVO01031394.1.p1 GENE.GHVO01031394.1~~GHVO01031394.1.p1  ORF type:complete len:104 (+),score=13.20 GHVO01031394.1:80-391(+)